MPAKKSTPRGRTAARPKLLAGGNPQIAKGDGDATVRIFIEAMPGWKRDVGRRLDALVEQAVPHVRKAVRWNSPFYGVEGNGWFLGFHCLTKYVKLAFFKGTSLKPPPPVASTQEDVHAGGRSLLPHPRGGRDRRSPPHALDQAGGEAARQRLLLNAARGCPCPKSRTLVLCGSGSPVPCRRTFTAGILPAAHSLEPSLRHPGSARPPHAGDTARATPRVMHGRQADVSRFGAGTRPARCRRRA
jgi:hypothetical protein